MSDSDKKEKDNIEEIAKLNGWAQAIVVSWQGFKEVLYILLPSITIYLMYITKSQVNEVKAIGDSVQLKTDKAVEVAAVAAKKTEDVKVALDQSTTERDKRLEDIHKTGLENNAALAQLRATQTKDPSDLIEAKAAEKLLESHNQGIAK